MEDKLKNFRWRLKTIGSIYHHDSQWKEIFTENNLKWKNWWDEYCDGMCSLTGSFTDDKLDKNGLRNSVSIFNKKGEDKFIEWLYSGNKDILDTFYEWFADCMEKQAIKKLDSIDEENKTKNNNTEKEGYIYVIKSNEYYKIGKSLDPKNRVKTYITENPDEVEPMLCEKVSDYTKIESKLHAEFRNKKHRGEWFKLNEDDIIFIKEYLKSNL